MRYSLNILNKRTGNYTVLRNGSYIVGININVYMLFFNAYNYQLYKYSGM